MNINKKHYPEIDICRGIGIILVVLGHALKQTGVMNTPFEIMLSVIYSFHMPLFFVVSGFVSVKILNFNSIKERVDYIKNRAIRLLVPYFAVGFFYMPIKFVLNSFAVKPYDFSKAWKILIGENPNTVLWFLYTLFWVSVVSALLVNYKNFKAILGISMILSIVSYGADVPVEATKYLFFFLAGLFLRLHYEKVVMFLKGKWLYFVLTIFIAGNVVLYWTQSYGWTFITAVSGCLYALALSLKISAGNQKVCGVFALCGRYSMDIYILSDLIAIAFRMLLWNILGMNYLVCTLICFVVSMFLPIPISKYIIQKVKIFRLLVLGMK